jgi:phage shock protein PspC (stress-responsive transcriptional regulator)
VTFTEPFLPRHPWAAALLLGTAATPAGVVLAWLAPRPLDTVVAFPLVVVDIWAVPFVNNGAADTPMEDSVLVRLLLLALGIVLTWLFYVLVARLVLWRVVPRAADGRKPG